MVKPSEQHPALGDAAHLSQWIDQVQAQCGIENTDTIKAACDLSMHYGEDKPTSYSPSAFYEGLVIADTLAGLHLDPDTIAAGIMVSTALHTKIKPGVISDKLGHKIAKLIKGACDMQALDSISNERVISADVQVHNLRKMMLAMVDDARVIIIKLAERISIMRNIKKQSDAVRLKLAKDTMNIYAPLANQLGIAQVKWELEDLGFANLEPEKYVSIAKLLAEKRIDREKRIASFKKTLHELLHKADIQATITGRVKHIYSIHNKMLRKNVSYGEIYDVTAARILVGKIEECYSALGIVHATWDYVQDEFDDYISKPKPNGYQSIHTVVKGPDDKLIEIQIRTHQMHEESEYGVAAHWVYKEGRSESSSYEGKIARLRGLLAWHKELTHGETPLENFHDNVFEDQVYVFTPAGDIINLPKDATPLDFAYHIHSDVGHRCRGAKVNGKMVPLTYKLSTGERVSVLTTREPKPSRDWINPELGYLATNRARSKVQHWFKQLHHDEHVSSGKQLLDKELAKHGLHDVNLEKIAVELNLKTTVNLYASLSNGNVRIGHVLNAIEKKITRKSKPQPEIKHRTKPENQGKSHFSIEGVGDLLTTIAKCCKPIPGDEIVGYITIGRGVTIHRKNCSNISNPNNNDHERLFDVDWDKTDGKIYHTDVHIHAKNRPGLINDITSVLSNHKINVIGLNTQTNHDSSIADITITIETTGHEMLGNILDHLSQIPNIVNVKRNHTGSQ